MPEQLPAEDRPSEPDCPQCGATLTYIETEIASGAFRTQAASMPQMPIHFYDCSECGTCWKLGQRLLPDPIRQMLRDVASDAESSRRT
jgi:predicted nucleic acid-binding Zn ribbon protein